MNAELDLIKKRLLYRSTHRGTKELDMILGRFCQKELANFSQEECQDLQVILELDEDTLLNGIKGLVVMPDDINHRIFAKILESL